MYRVPSNLDLTEIIGQFTTQILVGQFDIQFSLGNVHFAIQSSIKLVRNAEVIGTWREGVWPPPQFFELMNVEVDKYAIPNDRMIVIYLKNGIEIHLSDDWDQYESMQISLEGDPRQWII